MPSPETPGDYRRAFAFVLPYRRRLAAILALSLISTLAGLAQPYIAKLLIDEALLGRNLGALAAAALLMVGLTLAGFLLSILSSYRYVKVSAEVLFDMRLALYRHLQTLSPRFYARTRLGEIVSRINNDVAEIQRVSADAILSLVANTVFLAGSVAIMVWLNWRLFLIGVAALPFTALAVRHYQGRLTDRVRRMRESSAAVGSFLIETLMGMRLVAASAAQRREVERFRAHNQGFLDALLAMQLTSYLAGAVPGTLLTLSTAAVFFYGGRQVIDGAMSVGGLVAFLAYHLRLLAPVQSLFGLYTSLATARVSLGRVFELLDTPAEVRERPDALPIGAVRGEIAFDQVHFRHDRDTAVLDGVSFRVPAGGLCVIAGPSGAGKSTIADLVVRFYDPDGGAVLLDGRDLRDLRLGELRRAVGIVDQHAFLFHATIAENIAYGSPDAGREEIAAAARSAVIHDFILSLPEGYQTIVGERGLALSAGERQRIAIARALLGDPTVLVLDEPTAALDPATEENLLEAIARLRHGRTTLVITHRTAPWKFAGQVLVLEEDGRLAQAV